MQPAKTVPLAPGDELELRVGRLWFWEGYYSRVGIDLVNFYGSELIQVTDLDLLAIGFGPGLEPVRIIGESKSGTGKSAPKPLDRIVWLRGLQELVHADRAELTVAVPVHPRARELARASRTTVQSKEELAARENAIRISDFGDAGAHGPNAFLLRKTVQSIVRDSPSLAASFKFLTSTVWFLDPYSVLKQTLGLLQGLSAQWTPNVRDSDQLATRWLIAEALSVWVLNLVTIAGHIRPMTALEFTAHVGERLADGVVPAQKLRQLSRDFDKFVAGLLVAVQASPEVRVEAMGAFEPEPPEWAESLAELVLRLSADRRISDLPRQFDVIAHDRLARERPIDQAVAAHLGLDLGHTRKSVALVNAFLRNYGGITDDLSAILQDTSTVEGPSGKLAE